MTKIKTYFLIPIFILFSIAGCKSEGEQRLIGMWEPSPIQPADKEPTTQPTNPIENIFFNLSQMMTQWENMIAPSVSVTFNSDGTFSEAYGSGSRREVILGNWEVIVPGEEQITVRLQAERPQTHTYTAPTSQTTDVTIRFLNENEMIYPVLLGREIRMTRLQPSS